MATKNLLMGKEELAAHRMGRIVEIVTLNAYGEPEFIQITRSEYAKIKITEQPFF